MPNLCRVIEPPKTLSVLPPRNSALLLLASTWQLVASILLPPYGCLVWIWMLAVVVGVLVDPAGGDPFDQCEEEEEEEGVVGVAFRRAVRELKRDR